MDPKAIPETLEIIQAGPSSIANCDGKGVIFDFSNADIVFDEGSQFIVAPELNIMKNSFPVDIPYHEEIPNKVKKFYGREKKLEKMHTILEETSIVVISQDEEISRFGGVGKTEMAKEYAFKYSDLYKIILYLDGKNEKSLLREFHRIADIFKVNTQLEVVDDDEISQKIPKPLNKIVCELYSRFSLYETLIIIDNMAEQEQIINCLPGFAEKSLKIIITSRQQDWDLGDFGVIKTIPLKVFPLNTSIELIKTRLNEESEKLARCLSNFPLTLRQATRLIKKENKTRSEFTIDVYLNKFESNKDRFLKYKDDFGVYGLILMNTWSIAVEKLETEYGEAGIRAVKILKLLAYMKPDYVIKEYFHESDSKLNMEAISLLKDYSLIDVWKGYIFIHRFVQEVTKINVKEGNEEEIILEEVKKMKNNWKIIAKSGLKLKVNKKCLAEDFNSI